MGSLDWPSSIAADSATSLMKPVYPPYAQVGQSALLPAFSVTGELIFTISAIASNTSTNFTKVPSAFTPEVDCQQIHCQQLDSAARLRSLESGAMVTCPCCHAVDGFHLERPAGSSNWRIGCLLDCQQRRPGARLAST